MKKVIIYALAFLVVLALAICCGEPAEGATPQAYAITKLVALVLLVIAAKGLSVITNNK